jgi:hypothetical protein
MKGRQKPFVIPSKFCILSRREVINHMFYNIMIITKGEPLNRLGAGLVLIAVLLGSVALVFFSEPQILFFDIPHQYQKKGNEWLTVNHINNTTDSGTYTTVRCRNNGLLDGTFNIIVNLKNAVFSNQTIPSEIINGTIINVAFVLRCNEEASKNIYFVVNPNATMFEVSIALKSQFFLRSDVGGFGQTTFPYYMSSNNLWTSTETWSPVQIA